MELDPLVLSRIQFAITVGFHFLFPPLTIGLAWLLVIVEWLAWKRNDEVYTRAGKFFGKVLGLTFAIGVATGIVMEFQFGTNWAEYSRFVGDIFGAPLAAEAIFAFFLESTFLGMYLFGRNRVPKSMHFLSIFMVAFGATISAFWIIVANSWQQTPAGYVIRNGRAELTSFYEAVFNPSTIIRFTHVIVACLIAGAFLMMGISAYLYLRNKGVDVAKRTLTISLIVGFIAAVLSIVVTGHFHAMNVARYQPEKFATMEGVIESRTEAPLAVFGIPSEDPLELKNEIGIPGMLSIFAFGDMSAEIKGMREFHEDGWPTPPFAATFYSFHIMVMLAMAFLALTGFGVLLMLLHKQWDAKWYLKILPWTIPLPLLACEVGWILTEVGRQPWVVYRELKTADAYSFNVSGGEVLTSIIMFSLIYLLLGTLYVFLLVRKVKHGPEEKTVALEAREVK